MDIRKASLVRQPLLDWKLTAFKSAADAWPAAGFLALCAAAGRLAFAAAVAATDSLSIPVRARTAAQIIEC